MPRRRKRTSGRPPAANLAAVSAANAIDLILAPTLRNEERIVDQFVFRLRAWEPRIPCGFTLLPDPSAHGVRIVSSGGPWSASDVERLEQRIHDLAREFGIAVTVRRFAIDSPVPEDLWDVSWVDHRLRQIDERAEAARGRIKRHNEEMQRYQKETNEKISSVLSLFEYKVGDDWHLVITPEHAVEYGLENAVPELPDFFKDPTAEQEVVESILASGLSLSATVQISSEVKIPIWRCIIADLRPNCRDSGRSYSAECTDLRAAICVAYRNYLEALGL